MKNSLFSVVDGDADQLIIEADFPNLTAVQLFNAFTQPEQLSRWWPQEAETDLQPGGAYCLAWPSMNWHLRGTYTAFEPAKLLGFTWNWDHEPQLPEREVVVEMTTLAQGSRLRLTHGRYGGDAVELADRQSHRDGWLHFLGQLQGLD